MNLAKSRANLESLQNRPKNSISFVTHIGTATKNKCTWCGAEKLVQAEGGESGHVLELKYESTPRMNVHSGGICSSI